MLNKRTRLSHGYSTFFCTIICDCYGLNRGVDLWADPSKRQETGGEYNARRLLIEGRKQKQVQEREKRKIKRESSRGCNSTDHGQGVRGVEVEWWWTGGLSWDDGLRLEVVGGEPGRSSRTGNRGGGGNRGGVGAGARKEHERSREAHGITRELESPGRTRRKHGD